MEDNSTSSLKNRAKKGDRLALAELARRGIYPKRLWKRFRRSGK